MAMPKEMHPSARVIRRIARLARGQCVQCSNRALPNRSMCAKHLKESTKRQLIKIEMWRKAGLCRKCGSRKPRNKAICARCVMLRQGVRKRIQSRVKIVVLAAKSKPCADCSTRLPPEVMHLDHVRGTKKFALKHHPRRSMRAVLAEIKKCKVRCPNCHAMRHYRRRNGRNRKS